MSDRWRWRWGFGPVPVPWGLSLRSSLGAEAEQGLVELDGLAALDEDLGDRAGEAGVDVGEDLHGLDDADGRLGADGRADADERGGVGGGGGVEGADHGAADVGGLRGGPGGL